MIYIRNRSQSWGTQTGSQFNSFTGATSFSTTNLGSSVCKDVIGNYPSDNTLEITHSGYRRVGTVSGTRSIYTFNGWPHGSQGTLAHLSLVGELSDIDASTKGAARTNPGRPKVSLPVFIGELRDIPRMLWERGQAKLNRGRHRARKGSNSVAEVNFGWAPLFDDLLKMLDFNQHVEDRVGELQALYSKSGLKRTTTVWRASTGSLSGNLTIHSLSGQVIARTYTHTSARQWVSSRWRPVQPGLPPANELLQRAKFAVHGWRISPADVWNLMPWSWFFDYFANVGDLLDATSNGWEYKLESSCVMTERITERRFQIVSQPSWYTVTPGVQTYVTKRRVPSSLGLSTRVPFLSVPQLVTLMGIAANR